MKMPVVRMPARQAAALKMPAALAHQHRRAPQPQQGFTLLEVLVALAITALALGAGLRAAGVLTHNAQRLGDVLAAQWCADNQLADMRLMRLFPGAGDSSFECDQLGGRYIGKLVTRSTPNPNFRRVDAEMADAEGRPLLRLTAIVARP